MKRRHFVTATDQDRALYQSAEQAYSRRAKKAAEFIPSSLCGNARADARLSAYGYKHWKDLFNSRQLLHLSLLAEAISRFEGPIHKALAMAFSDHLTTNCMMTAYAAGWRRITPLFSVRAFRHVPRPVEINPWSDGTGRGTYPNAVRKLLRAREFARNPVEPKRRGGFTEVPAKAPIKPPTIISGNAKNLSSVTSHSVDIVLTDPPYFDNIAYSDLAAFFLPWLELLKIVNDPQARRRVSIDSLVGRRNDVKATERYTKGLSAAFKEIARVLKPNGLVVFSFRHAVPEAWNALADAIASSSLTAAYFLPAPGEAGVGLHAHEGTGLWDAVFVLRSGSLSRHKTDLRICPKAVIKVKAMVEKWVNDLRRASLPFTQIDKLTMIRAGYVAASLGFHQQSKNASKELSLSQVLKSEKD
jgi:adenine-specific DNA methylase